MATRINAERNARIVALRACGLTFAQIAREVGISKSVVGSVVRQHEHRKCIGATGGRNGNMGVQLSARQARSRGLIPFIGAE